MAGKTPETPEMFADKFTRIAISLMLIVDAPAAVIGLADEILNNQLTTVGEVALTVGLVTSVIGLVSILMARHGVFGPKE